MTNYNFIKLAQVKEDGEVEYKTYVTPSFIPFRMLYEATSIMSGMEEKSEEEAMTIMINFIVKIYNNQFTMDDVIDGLSAPDAVAEIQQQIEFVASGQLDADKKGTEQDSEIDNQSVGSWEEHKENLNNVIKDMMKEGEMGINEVLDMPFSFMMDDLYAQNKKTAKKSSSMLEAFGVSGANVGNRKE